MDPPTQQPRLTAKGFLAKIELSLIQALNGHWDEERLYQETRRIVAAQIQHITYSEFLPIIIGKENLRTYGLALQTHAYDSNYDMASVSSRGLLQA